ncbi:MAG: type II secretion system protein GspG [Kiritimatiellae bacterium]|nr:type II secretion system protein GspG [Kiritimatiellia bacterium]
MSTLLGLQNVLSQMHWEIALEFLGRAKGEREGVCERRFWGDVFFDRSNEYITRSAEGSISNALAECSRIVVGGKREKKSFDRIYWRKMNVKEENEMKNKKNNKDVSNCAGFTLVEIMLVVIIIGILATVVVGKFGGVSERASRNATRASIGNIGLAVEAYEMEAGKFPASLQDLTQGTDERAPLLASLPIDAWGTEFQYKKTGKFTYEVRSAGPDASFGSSDDITN